MSWRGKTRWAAAVLAAACAVPIAGRLQAQTHTVAEQYLFYSMNVERAAAGLAPLAWSESLTGAAESHALRMRAAGALSHQFRGEPDVAARASSYGARFSLVAENVATSPSVLQMHTALMHSPDHRANILDPNVSAVGISVVALHHQLWAVEDFARDVQEFSLAEQEQQVSQLLVDAGLAPVTRNDAARATCEVSTGFVGSRPTFVMRYTASSLNNLPQQLTARLAQGGVSGAAVGACASPDGSNFTTYHLAVLLYR